MKKILLIILALFLIAQFFKPTKNEGNLNLTAFIEETKPPKGVQIMMKDACYDCHSNKTNYPWYNNVTPINFWLAHHIDEGKSELNFSDWENYSPKRKIKKMQEIAEEVEEKHMPITPYTFTHPKSKLSKEQINTLVTWAESFK